MRPDISVVIPAYNTEVYIEASIRSVLNQKGVTVEAVVVDDGSTDGTANKVRPFVATGRVKLVQQANMGLPAARNTGLGAATGRYIGFLDGDDLWKPDKARLHIELMDSQPDLDMTYSWWGLIDGNGAPAARRDCARPAHRVPGGLTFEGLVLENFTGNGSTSICRPEALEKIGGFDPALRSSCEDLDAWLRLAVLRDGNIGLVPRTLTSYRVHPEQMSRDWNRMLAGWETVIEKARKIAPDRLARVEHEARARQNLYLAQVACGALDHASARRLLARAVTGAPGAMWREPRTWRVAATNAAYGILPARFHPVLTRATRWRRHMALRRVGGAPVASRHDILPELDTDAEVGPTIKLP